MLRPGYFCTGYHLRMGAYIRLGGVDKGCMTRSRFRAYVHIYLLCRTEGGQKLEPLEEVVCEVEEEFGGAIIEALTLRKGEVTIFQRIALVLQLGGYFSTAQFEHVIRSWSEEALQFGLKAIAGSVKLVNCAILNLYRECSLAPSVGAI